MPSSAADRLEAAVRPRIPQALLPPLVRARARRMRANPAEWASGQRQMRFLTGVRDPDVDLEALTLRYLELQVWRTELRWHPELMTHQRVEGLEHLVAARDAGRGVLLSFLHHALYDGIFGSLTRLGVPCRAVATPTMFSADCPQWMRQQSVVNRTGGNELISAGLGSAAIADILRAGTVVAIAADVSRSTPLTFLGQQVTGASGFARIAFELGTPVVLVTSHRDPDGPVWSARLRVAEPLEPASFASPEEMLAAMLTHLEGSASAWPEAYDEPLRRWTWVGEPDP